MEDQKSALKIIDTHAHPQMKQYDTDREAVIGRAIEAKIGLICVGVDLESSKKAIELAEKYPENIWASIGLHPNDNLDEKYDQSEYESLAKNPNVVAIGEIGLDYYRTKGIRQLANQKERFIEQLKLAEKLNKPVIIHCRDAHEDMLKVLSTFSAEGGSASGGNFPPSTNQLRGVIHSFTGTWEQAKKYIEHGFYIGLNGIITFTDQYNETVKNIPVEKLLLETDAPYLSPTPNRGKRNESAYIVYTAQKIADLKGIKLEDLLKTVKESTQRLLGLNL